MGNVIKLPALESSIEIAPDWIAARDQIVSDAANIRTITDDAAFRTAGEVLKKLTKTSNAMESFRKKYAEPYAEAVKTIKVAADAARDPLEKEKARIQTALNRYAADQQRKAEEKRKRLEEEHQRAIQKQLAEQERAKADAIALGLDAPEPFEPEPPAQTLPEVSAPKSDAVRVQSDVAWSCTDEEKVDRAFLSLDSRKVNEYVRANKERIMEAIKSDSTQAEKMLFGITFEIKTKVISR